jgi:anti-anti-sigma factor
MSNSPLDHSDEIGNNVTHSTELVKGQEQKFLDELKPLVLRQSVRLDLSGIERIDAAGLAALITVYCDARQAGHDFTISNPSHRVAEILAIVGLDKLLVASHADEFASPAHSYKSRQPDLLAISS